MATPQTQKDTELDGTGAFVVRTRDFGFLPIPPAQRYEVGKSFKFTLFLNILFAFATTFTAAGLYYCQPLLINMSETFDVSFQRVSNIPTLTQAGYATGILLISPLGDLVRRRPLIILIMTLSSTACLSLALVPSIIGFEVLSFVLGVVTVTPQIMIPFVADLAPPERRARAISIVFSGILLGVLVARVLAGVVGQFTAWENIFYVGAATQYVLLILLYFLLPDWPRNMPKNSKGEPLNYFGILWSMVKFSVTEPLLIQGCLIAFLSSAVFANFWTTLTFLLGGPPYFYSTVDIGLFGLVGMLGVCTAPVVGRLIDQTVPWFANLISIFIMILFQSILTGAAGINIGAVIVACFGLDVGQQMSQISIIARIYSHVVHRPHEWLLTKFDNRIEPTAKARLNSILIICVFLGMVMGTSVGTRVFVHDGWRPAAGLSLGWIGIMLLLLLLRGPHCARTTWLGWEGGYDMSKHFPPAPPSVAVEKDVEMGPVKEMDDTGEDATPQLEPNELR